MRSFFWCVIAVLLCYASNSVLFAELIDHWGACRAWPAVVNPVAVSPLQQVISLRGKWDFVTDPGLYGRHRMGKGPGWNEPDWRGVRSIEVPGCWEAQGVGEAGMSQTWDLPFDRIPRPLNHVYMGTVRYRRSVDIPKDWRGKRIWLKVGGVRTEAWFWVNKQRVAHLNTYCGSYKYDITDLVRPGESAEIVATVRNDTPSRKGCKAAFHRFGGFYRDIELEATPVTWIDDVWVRSDISKPSALVNVSVGHAGAVQTEKLGLEILVKSLDNRPVGKLRQFVTLDGKGAAELVCELPLKEVGLWSPETPNLYLAEVTLLAGDAPVHGWVERFGLRKLEVRGGRFFLNGKPFFIRGYGDRSRDARIRLIPQAASEADEFLAGDEEASSRLGKVTSLIEGFETPYGLELLSTVYWVAKEKASPARDANKAIEKVHAWSARKRRLFKPDHIRIAWERLHDKQWLNCS